MKGVSFVIVASVLFISMAGFASAGFWCDVFKIGCDADLSPKSIATKVVGPKEKFYTPNGVVDSSKAGPFSGSNERAAPPAGVPFLPDLIIDKFNVSYWVGPSNETNNTLYIFTNFTIKNIGYNTTPFLGWGLGTKFPDGCGGFPPGTIFWFGAYYPVQLTPGQSYWPCCSAPAEWYYPCEGNWTIIAAADYSQFGSLILEINETNNNKSYSFIL